MYIASLLNWLKLKFYEAFLKVFTNFGFISLWVDKIPAKYIAST